MAENSESVFKESVCVICKDDGVPGKLVRVRAGLDTLIKFSISREDIPLNDYLNQQKVALQPRKIYVHENCRRDYVNSLRIADGQDNTTEPKAVPTTRSSIEHFDWKLHCFYCGTEAKEDAKHPERKKVFRATLLHFRDNLLKLCDEKLKKDTGDDWTLDVQRRLHSCIDLVQAEARYHEQCRTRFQINEFVSPLRKARGGQTDLEAEVYFNQACEYLENNAEIISLRDLHEMMREMANYSDHVYSDRWLKHKLEKKYGDHLFFSEINGKENMICFRDMANYIIHEKWYEEKKEHLQDETERIVIAAAKLIMSEIRQCSYAMDIYPTLDEIKRSETDYLPPSLQVLMKLLVPSKLKQNSIGQCLLKAARPNSVFPPLMFGLAVEMDSIFGSRWLIDELFRLGFCLSYAEVTKYKQTVVRTTDIDDVLSTAYNGCFTQWVADNIDHNIRTLDGQATFHGMGMMAVSTKLEEGVLVQEKAIERPTKVMKVKDITVGKAVPIACYDYPDGKGLKSIVFKPINQLLLEQSVYSSPKIDLLWHSASFFKIGRQSRPNWSGFMQHVSHGEHPPVSTITMLPIIDLNPSDYSCIYSVLVYIQHQAKHLNVPIPCITFDQPLYFKAMEIITTKSMNVVARLGGFHTLMSFLGSVGDLMAGSGLEEALEMASYGKNAVGHMMSGKAISRALRGHMLVDAALNITLMDEMIPDSKNNIDTEVEHNEDSKSEHEELTDSESESQELFILDSSSAQEKSYQLNEVDYDELKEVCNQVMVNGYPCNEVDESKALQKLQAAIETKKEKLSLSSRTAKLWLSYCMYIDVVKQFIRAERTSDWEMHLSAVGKMLNLFAATGHIHYTKSGRLYLQTMKDLPKKHPWLYEQLAVNKLFTVRRSDRYWAGLWTDLSIEQVLMKSIKSRGGLTRGRGMTESTRLLWIYSMHRCAAIHNAMTSVTGLSHSTSEQHVEMGSTRCNRDTDDLKNIKMWFTQHDPFNPNETELKSLSTGMTSSRDDGINCDEAETIGYNIQAKLDNVSVGDASVKRSEKIKALSCLQKGVIIENEVVYIDPLILFTRLIMLLKRSEDMANHFKYELTPVPTSLFKDYFMRKPNKASLATHLISGPKRKSKKRKKRKTGQRKGKKARTEAKEVQELECAECSEESAEEIPGENNENAATANVSEVPENSYFVLDGGSLLRKVVWPPNVTYREVIRQYQTYVKSKYGTCSIIFDGYGNGPNTKDHEHKRRKLRIKPVADIAVTENLIAYKNQHAFLSNDANKVQFIELLGKYLVLDGHHVEVCTGDADTQIVACALEKNISDRSVVVVANDTDVLVLLLHFFCANKKSIIMLREPKKRSGKRSVLNIKDIASHVNPAVLENILPLHAWSGCDTTSALYGKGKAAILKLVQQSEEVKRLMAILSNEKALRENIANAGIRLAILMYGGKHEDSLSSLRFANFMKMAASSSKLQPEKLPPSERAVVFHTWRVHLQVVQWKTLMESEIDPLLWGWTMVKNELEPIMTDDVPAPDDLLKFIRCSCKASSRNPCNSNVCTCYMNGLKCVTACGDCRGLECRNKDAAEKDEVVTESEEIEDVDNNDGNLFVERQFDL